MDIQRNALYFMQIPASISLITEMIVPLSYIIFKDLQQLKYVQFVLFISIGIYEHNILIFKLIIIIYRQYSWFYWSSNRIST